MDLHLRTLSTDAVVLPEAAIAALRATLRGTALLPDDPGYDAARSVWNAMIDRHPALIVQAAGAADVMRTVAFAHDHHAVLAVRGGGHNVAGNAVCDGGVMLDLSHMRSVHVDPAARRARVEGGATLGDVDRETQAFGLAVPLGINSTTGVAGLTLGGGFGWTSRKLGLSVDNLESVDVVTADGRLHHADSHQDADLFWAVRGGGGNFGVVTSFDFRLHALGPQVVAGLIAHPLDDAPALIPHYRALARAAPDELTCWLLFRKAPAAPFIPSEWHDRPVMVIGLCHTGALDAGLAAAAPFRALGHPIADLVGPQPFVAWQAGFDAMLPPGARNYWKSHDLKDLTDAAGMAVVEAMRRVPTSETDIIIAHLGGQIGRLAAGDAAYSRRGVEFLVSIHARWSDPGQDTACIGWARGLFEELAPHATGSVYVNFMTNDEADRVRGAYGPNFDRLAEIKRRYDPENLFRLNQNIRID